ncbi:hypothetical protein GCM10011399_30980 [Subtercola lobariae]|uniref:Integral membrane bound transporter domain-containing protein n=1 Tax=Subtercola lobariae TaxID=1588641 RepID=A0A917F1M0_9MICO|nr:hypothetical protein GCM10011399_30980 [Subtercola lobariae]
MAASARAGAAGGRVDARQNAADRTAVVTRFDPRLLLLRRAVVTMAAALASFFTMWFAGLPLAVGVTPAVLAVVLTITFSRTESKASESALLQRFVLIPLVAAAATGVAWLFSTVFPVGALVFILGLSLSIWVRRFGPRAARLGSVLSLPLMAVLIVPVQLPRSLPAWLAIAISVVAALVAVAWVELLQWLARVSGFLPRRDLEASARLDAAADGVAGSAAGDAAAGGSAAGGADADGMVGPPPRPADATTSPDASRPTAATSPDASRPTAATSPDASRPTAATSPDASRPTAATSPTTRVAVSPPSRPQPRRILPSTRMAAQLAVALAAAFIVGRLVFPDHWAWVVLTAFIVCAGNRGRGDVVYKSILRVAGAVAGTVAVVALTEMLGAEGGTTVTIAIFTILFFALWLRDINYAFWAAGVTVILALLQTASGASVLTGGPLLGERIVAIVVGALCGVLASWFLLPVRTEAVVRKRLADALAAASVAVHPSTEPTARLSALALFEQKLDLVEPVARAVRSHRGFTRLWRHSPHPADLIAAVAALEPLVADLVDRLAPTAAPSSAVPSAALPPPSPARLGAIAKAVGAARRALASTPRLPRGEAAAAQPTKTPSPPAPGTDAAIAAIAQVRTLLLDALVDA